MNSNEPKAGGSTNMREVYLSDLKPWYRKNPWAVKPMALLLLISVAWWLIPATMLWETRKDMADAFGELWAMVWKKPI